MRSLLLKTASFSGSLGILALFLWVMSASGVFASSPTAAHLAKPDVLVLGILALIASLLFAFFGRVEK
jgi:hypothetical protein